MWSLLISFGNWFIMNVLRVAVIKFTVFSAIAMVVAALAAYIFNALVNIDLLTFGNMLESLPDGILYFLTVFQVHVGIPMFLGALVARFTIRRLPVVG